ncbi:hypothetical protein [Gloeomargarita lithophora]|nr:hypothetical protein [Gloeomargarita lithophora]
MTMKIKSLFSVSIATVCTLVLGMNVAQANPKLETVTEDGEVWPSFMMPGGGIPISFPPEAPYMYPTYLNYDSKTFILGVNQNTNIRTNSVLTDKFTIAPFRDYTGDGVQNLDDIPGHQKQYNQALAAWIAKVQGCLADRPNMFRVVGEDIKVPITVNGQAGKIFLNANKKPVCPG